MDKGAGFKLIQVGQDKTLIRDFLDMANPLYKDFPNWIRPLDQDIESVFDPKKNKYFRQGSCIRWVLKEGNQTIGRVAAFIDKKNAAKQTQPTGGMGFFECINNQEAANILFNACKNWLKEQGMEAMDGPINFGDRDRFWGLHISGDLPPNYGMFYHRTYYKQLFENYGFGLFFKQITYGRRALLPLHPSTEAKAVKAFADMTDLEFKCLEPKKLDKYTEDFRTIYNKAWAKHGVPEMRPEMAKSIMKKMKPIMDPRVMYFGYHKGVPVSFFISVPDVNQIFRHFNGKLGIMEKLRFLFLKHTGGIKKFVGLVFGVIPEYQGKGVEAAMVSRFRAYIYNYKNFPYPDFEMNWIGDFNPKMMNVAKLIAEDIYKEHATYRYLFDREKPFERHPIIR